MNKKILWIPIGLILTGVLINTWLPEEEAGSKFEALIPKHENAEKCKDLKNLEMHIDFSGSMKGFIDFSNTPHSFSAQNIFVSTTTTLLDKVESEYSIKTQSFCGGKSYSKDVFRGKLEDKSIFNEGTTLLHNTISQLSKKANDSTVIAIATDMILSYGKAKIIAEKDTFYNKHNLDGLSAAVYGAMTNLKSKKLDIVIAQYLSDFNGKYYYNYTENVAGTNAYRGTLMKERPFYVLLMGKKETLKDMLQRECFRIEPNNIYASFGIDSSDMTKAEYAISENESTCFWNKGIEKDKVGGFWTSSDLDDQKTTFHISCSKFHIPNYINHSFIKGSCTSDKEYIVTNIKYDNSKSSMSFDVTTPPFNAIDKEKEVIIDIVSQTDWATKCNTDDDIAKKDEELKGKTWGLSKIIEAIDQAFHGNNRTNEELVGSFKFMLLKK